MKRLIGYGLPIAWIAGLIAFGGTLSPVERFVGATVTMFLAIKLGSSLVSASQEGDGTHSPMATLLYWLAWPGVRRDLFDGTANRTEPDGRTFVVGYAFLMAGLALGLVSLLAAPSIGQSASTWLLLFASLAVVHAGIGRILPFTLRWLGIAVPPLFDAPLRSQSVADFWSERWNRPFIDMNRRFVTSPLAPRIGIGAATFVAFAVSGLLHELAISYPAGAGWGMPMLYFLVQGGLYTVEKQLFPDGSADHSRLRNLWTLLAVGAPLPLLFHAPFRMTFLAPLIEAGRSILLAPSVSTYVSAGLWVGAAGHFLVLAASFQVPDELDWHADLASLTPLNRKLHWTYGAYIVLMIVTFGVFTLVFHREFVSGTPVALGLCGLIALFWTVRVLVDSLYFSHDDWPSGLKYVVGHVLLTSLFGVLIAVYGGTLAAHALSAV